MCWKKSGAECGVVGVGGRRYRVTLSGLGVT